MKQGMNLNKEFSKCDVISPEMFEGYKQQLITLKNAQEEIGKYEERNRLTIDDIRSEIETQNESRLNDKRLHLSQYITISTKVINKR